jgi:hypothetical protein
MPPHDADDRDRDAWSRLRQFAEKTNGIDSSRDRPGPASCRRAVITPVVSAYEEDEDDGPITTRWAAG